MTALVLASGSGLLAARPAQAAFPGADGAIVVSTTRLPTAWRCPVRHHGAQLVLVHTGAPPALLTCVAGSAVHPFISPDGSEIVFAVHNGAWSSRLYTLPTTAPPGRHRLATPVSVSAPGATDDDPSWSPAGDGTIVFQRSVSGGPSQLFFENVADPAGASPVFATPTGSDDTAPVFDPADANLIAFVRPVGGNSHIFTYELVTHVLQDLSAQGDGGRPFGDTKPDFAPTGDGIVFASDRMCRSEELFTMTLQGTAQTPVSSPRRVGHGRASCASGADDPVFSPEGDALAFDDTQGQGCPEVFIVPVAPGPSGVRTTGRPHTVGSGDEPDWAPVVDPPADAPETSLPIALPVVGVAVATSGLYVRRRRARRRAFLTSKADTSVPG